jgi:hypothetical protein
MGTMQCMTLVARPCGDPSCGVEADTSDLTVFFEIILRKHINYVHSPYKHTYTHISHEHLWKTKAIDLKIINKIIINVSLSASLTDGKIEPKSM